MTEQKLRVCSFESRRENEIGRLIEKFGGVATVAPSMQELPLDSNEAAFKFADRLEAGQIDIVILMTGVGTDALFTALAGKWTESEFAEKLKATLIVARGPKPVAALSKKKMVPSLRADEPNTWHEIKAAIDAAAIDLNGKTVAVQEYGLPSHELYTWLESVGAEVFPVPIYRWELPDDIGPLKQAVQSTIARDFDVLMWTSAQQVVHVLEVAEQMGCREEWLKAAQTIKNASIGPTASERLRDIGINPDMEPSHPKMAHLVRETIERFS